jgi:hypothetical protein
MEFHIPCSDNFPVAFTLNYKSLKTFCLTSRSLSLQWVIAVNWKWRNETEIKCFLHNDRNKYDSYEGLQALFHSPYSAAGEKDWLVVTQNSVNWQTVYGLH